MAADSATGGDARKRQAELQARAALLGITLHRLAAGRWLACRWGLSKEIDDADLEVWLQRAGGAQ